MNCPATPTERSVAKRRWSLGSGEWKRPVLVVVAGPLSLVRTNGIYYLRELLRSFDVVLVGWKDYEGDRAFEVASSWPGVETKLLPPLWEPRNHHCEFAAFADCVA